MEAQSELVAHLQQPSSGSQAEAPSPPRTWQEKTFLIKRQLVLLLHCKMCKLEDQLYPDAPRGQCQMPHCALLKSVLGHINTCTSQSCQVVHCSSSKQILEHWMTCDRLACPVCPPRLRNVHGPSQPQAPPLTRSFLLGALPRIRRVITAEVQRVESVARNEHVLNRNETVEVEEMERNYEIEE